MVWWVALWFSRFLRSLTRGVDGQTVGHWAKSVISHFGSVSSIFCEESSVRCYLHKGATYLHRYLTLKPTC